MNRRQREPRMRPRALTFATIPSSIGGTVAVIRVDSLTRRVFISAVSFLRVYFCRGRERTETVSSELNKAYCSRLRKKINLLIFYILFLYFHLNIGKADCNER